jgi:hypothetical protein
VFDAKYVDFLQKERILSRTLTGGDSNDDDRATAPDQRRGPT